MLRYKSTFSKRYKNKKLGVFKQIARFGGSCDEKIYIKSNNHLEGSNEKRELPNLISIR